MTTVPPIPCECSVQRHIAVTVEGRLLWRCHRCGRAISAQRVPAGRAVSQYERDRLAGEARRAAAVPYEYEEPQEAAHRPTPGWTWVGIALALAAFGGAVWAGVAGYRALCRLGWMP